MENTNTSRAAAAFNKIPLRETVTLTTPKCGKLIVVVEGHRSKGETVILTVHDLGTNTREYREFLAQPCMNGIARRCVWMHVTVPGQEETAADIPNSEGKTSLFTLQQLAEDLVYILDQLKVSSVVVLGDGAGANVLLRFVMFAKERVLGAILLNCTATSAGFLEAQREKAVGRRLSRAKSVSHSSEEQLAYLHFGAKSGEGSSEFEKHWEEYCDYLRNNINAQNLNLYLTAFYERNNLLPLLNKLSCPLLLIAGARSEFAHTVHSLNATIQRALKEEPEKRRQMEYLRVDGVVSPLHEKPEKLAECIQYFLQGLGLLGSLSPIFLSSTASFVEKDSIVEFRSQLEKNFEASSAQRRTLDDSAQLLKSEEVPLTRGRRMSMQEYDVRAVLMRSVLTVRRRFVECEHLLYPIKHANNLKIIYTPT